MTFEKVKKWIPSILYALCLLALSSIPAKSLSHAPKMNDKVAHTLLYAGAGWNVAHVLTCPTSAIIAVAVWGAIDENYQRLTPGRSCDFYDWCADVFGGSIGAAIYILYARRKRA